MRHITLALTIAFLSQLEVNAANILYLNSTRGYGTDGLGDFRSSIADTLDTYEDGNIFDVDFVQNHITGDLSVLLKAKPIDYYDQIWFDTTIFATSILNDVDFDALNTWAANNQPEFILDSSFFFRNKKSTKLTDAAISVTVNQALALQNVGGGIFIGTDNYPLTYTANQILSNFGFDSLFSGSYFITSNGSFVGDLLLEPEAVDDAFFNDNLKGLSASNVPIGEHVLNENANNRTIEIFENLFSLSPEKVSHIGSSFDTGNRTVPIDNPKDIPTPATGITLAILGISSWFRKKNQTDSNQ